MEKTTQNTAPTNTGEFSSRLSDKPTQGKHESFRVSDEFFKQIVDSLEDYAVFTTDTKGTISSWNTGATNMFNYSEAEVIGKNAAFLFTSEDNKNNELTRELAVAKENGRAVNERFHVRKDGNRFWASGLVFPLKDKSGIIRGFTKVMRDRTEEKRAASELKESELRFRNLADTAPMYIAMADETGNAIYFNKPWLAFTGKTMEEMKGLGWLSTLHPEDAPKFEREFKNAFSKQIPIKEQYRFRQADGKYRWMLAVGAPRFTPDRKFIGYFGTYTDIHDLKKAEEKRRQLEKQKDEFIGIASHELKTPVTSIKAYGQVLEKMFRKSGDIKSAEYVAKMDTQINRLTVLIADLLDVTKIQTGKLQFNEGYFDFNELVEEIVDDLQLTTDRHTLVKELSTTKSIYGDRDRIGQVLSNLITNAIKYSPRADKVIVSTSTEKDTIRLCVQDFGVGIPKKKREKVFEQFYRVSGDEEITFPGLGLGLYISSEIIKRQGGEIWVESALHKGSTFCIQLPIRKKPGHTHK
jgi:PAS domain S-box-containing protein